MRGQHQTDLSVFTVLAENCEHSFGPLPFCYSADVTAGTPAYMAPEQLEGGTFTVRGDIYSLGLVLYELFTGKRAFEAATLGDLVKLKSNGSG